MSKKEIIIHVCKIHSKSKNLIGLCVCNYQDQTCVFVGCRNKGFNVARLMVDL